MVLGLDASFYPFFLSAPPQPVATTFQQKSSAEARESDAMIVVDDNNGEAGEGSGSHANGTKASGAPSSSAEATATAAAAAVASNGARGKAAAGDAKKVSPSEAASRQLEQQRLSITHAPAEFYHPVWLQSSWSYHDTVSACVGLLVRNDRRGCVIRGTGNVERQERQERALHMCVCVCVRF